MENLPFLALVDDDPHSAQLLTRTLLSQGSPDIRFYGDAEAGRLRLNGVLAGPAGDWPDLLIIDLKAHSRANLEFMATVQSLARQKGVPIVVMAASLDSSGQNALREAGASAIFFRHPERDAYRREAAGIISFWARRQRPDAVGM